MHDNEVLLRVTKYAGTVTPDFRESEIKTPGQSCLNVKKVPNGRLQGLDPMKTEDGGQRSDVRFGRILAVNDKMVPDPVGSGISERAHTTSKLKFATAKKIVLNFAVLCLEEDGCNGCGKLSGF
jgi:hypothetical protein